MIPSSAEGLAAFDQALLDACVLLRPPEKLTISEWADKYFFLSAEGSSRPGKFYTSEAEYQREPFNVLTPGSGFQTVVLMWASQVGKTAVGLVFDGYFMQHDPAPILNIWPTEDLAKVVARDRIEPMIRDTPVLAALFGSTRRSGTEWNHKSFPGGQLSLGWSNSPSQVASRPIRAALSDEEGRMQANAEGDPIDQLRKRMATFPNRIHLRTSSPNLRRTCSITKAYEQSDKRRYYVPCPDCNHYQVLRFEQLRGSPEACWYECEACAYQIQESDKYGMVRNGRWEAEEPGGGDGKTAGFHLSALYSTIGYTWAEILADFAKCEGIPDKLQVFKNTVLAEPWDEEAEGADLNEVAKHAEEYPAQAPGWCVLITCGVDVQKDRIEATKWGWGLSEVAGVIEHRVFRGDPSRPAVWQDFEAWRRAPVEHESGLALPVSCTFVDSGDGNRTEAVYAYARPREMQRVYACKGSSQQGAPLVNRGTRQGKTRTLVVSVGTSTAKDSIYSRLQIADKNAPGYIHFPSSPESGCDRDFYKHLTAEVLVTRRTKGGEVSRWENPNRRNEALDCAVYARAAKEFIRANLKELARRLTARAEQLRSQGLLPDRNASASPASSPASASPTKPAQPPEFRQKRRKKSFKRPNAGWIYGG